jgi:hypothetical protein
MAHGVCGACSSHWSSGRTRLPWRNAPKWSDQLIFSTAVAVLTRLQWETINGRH